MEPIAWAKGEVDRLRQLEDANQWNPGHVAATMEFLRRQTGPQSAFTRQAEQMIQAGGIGLTGSMADLLQGYVEFAQAGMAQESPFEVRARVEASTDLMEQVQRLIDDGTVHLAAPIVLAGAALEEFLRSMIEREAIAPPTTRGIPTYARELRTTDAISEQDHKDLTAWAALHSAATQGRFDVLSPEAARIMVAGINLFMRQKAT